MHRLKKGFMRESTLDHCMLFLGSFPDPSPLFHHFEMGLGTTLGCRVRKVSRDTFMQCMIVSYQVSYMSQPLFHVQILTKFDYSQVFKYIHSYIAIVNVQDNESVLEIESRS